MTCERPRGGARSARLAEGARGEEPQVGLGAALVALDRKARPLHGALRLAVRAAAPAHARPQRLDPVLERGLPSSLGSNVLEHAQSSIGAEHALDFGQPARRVGHAAEDEARHHGVEDAGPERERLRAGAHQRHSPRAAPGANERAEGGVEPDRAHGRIVKRQAATGAAPKVERAPARAVGERSPPGAEPGALHQGAERVVEPRDLLETAHPSRLRKDDERAGVVVEEVAAADRRELAVAEECDQREFAETRADNRDVVVGRAEELAPAAGAVYVASEGRPRTVPVRSHLITPCY